VNPRTHPRTAKLGGTSNNLLIPFVEIEEERRPRPARHSARRPAGTPSRRITTQLLRRPAS
jgi:hypothetical protein